MKKKDLDLTRAQEMSSGEIAKYLQERERKFAQAYVKCGNATQAAIEAGYRPGKKNASAAVQGSRMLKDDCIKAYRMALIREELDSKDLSKESILLKLNKILDRCMEAVPVMTRDQETKEMIESGTWEFDSRGAVKAIEAINKMMGYDAPQKHEVKAAGIDELVSQMSGWNG